METTSSPMRDAMGAARSIAARRPVVITQRNLVAALSLLSAFFASTFVCPVAMGQLPLPPQAWTEQTHLYYPSGYVRMIQPHPTVHRVFMWPEHSTTYGQPTTTQPACGEPSCAQPTSMQPTYAQPNCVGTACGEPGCARCPQQSPNYTIPEHAVGESNLVVPHHPLPPVLDSSGAPQMQTAPGASVIQPRQEANRVPSTEVRLKSIVRRSEANSAGQESVQQPRSTQPKPSIPPSAHRLPSVLREPHRPAQVPAPIPATPPATIAQPNIEPKIEPTPAGQRPPQSGPQPTLATPPAAMRVPNLPHTSARYPQFTKPVAAAAHPAVIRLPHPGAEPTSVTLPNVATAKRNHPVAASSPSGTTDPRASLHRLDGTESASPIPTQAMPASQVDTVGGQQRPAPIPYRIGLFNAMEKSPRRVSGAPYQLGLFGEGVKIEPLEYDIPDSTSPE